MEDPDPFLRPVARLASLIADCDGLVERHAGSGDDAALRELLAIRADRLGIEAGQLGCCAADPDWIRFYPCAAVAP